MLERTSTSQRVEEEIVGNSSAFLDVLNQVRIIAKSDSVTLIQGETGTGKEVIARAIHNHSLRSSGPFVKLNCAAIPSSLWRANSSATNAELSPAQSRRPSGRFQQADKGTLFLDEIGDLPLELQPKFCARCRNRSLRVGLRADDTSQRARGGGDQPRSRSNGRPPVNFAPTSTIA